MNIALIGPSGSGKGTQLGRIGKQFKLFPLCTGSILRENLARKTALGLLARKYMSQGELVPDEVVDAMVESGIAAIRPKQGIAFDGFPRTVYQAKFLDDLLSGQKRMLDAVIYLKISPETVLRRLSGRIFCHSCHSPYHTELHPPKIKGLCDRCGGKLERRTDDSPEFAQLRLRSFQRATTPLLDYYSSSQRLAVVDAEAAAEVVFASIRQAI